MVTYDRHSEPCFDVPVVFIIFNRPEHARRVLDRIREVRPRILHVIADGPRAHQASDAESCARTRALIDGVDWPCEIVRDYAETNLGCGKRIATGLDRVFQAYERAVIIEDDCLPDPSFFPYCEALLDYYAEDSRVMSITGELDSEVRPPGDADYFFSSLPRVWGWATWRRAWRGYDFELSDWSDQEAVFQRRLKGYYKGGRPLGKRMQKVVDGRIDTWDYQWWYQVFKNEGLCINPRLNLVTNIGFDAEGTHMTQESDRGRSIDAQSIQLPLRHLSRIELDPAADRHFFFERFGRPFNVRFRRAIERALKGRRQPAPAPRR